MLAWPFNVKPATSSPAVEPLLFLEHSVRASNCSMCNVSLSELSQRASCPFLQVLAAVYVHMMLYSLTTDQLLGMYVAFVCLHTHVSVVSSLYYNEKSQQGHSTGV